MKTVGKIIVVLLFFPLSGCFVGHIYWSADSRYFISMLRDPRADRNRVVKVDTQTGEVRILKIDDEGRAPIFLALSPDLKNMAVTFSDESQTTTVIYQSENATSYSVTRVLPAVYFHPASQWSPAGDRLALLAKDENEENSYHLLVYDIRKDSLKPVTAFHSFGEDEAINYIWFDNEHVVLFIAVAEQKKPQSRGLRFGHSVLVDIDRCTSDTINKDLVLPSDSLPYDFAFALPRQRVLVFPEKTSLRWVNVDRKDEHREYPLNANIEPFPILYSFIFGLRYDPQMEQVYFSANAEDREVSNLFMYDPIQQNVQQLTYFTNNAHLYHPSLSPDGRKLACFFSYRESSAIILIENNRIAKVFTLDPDSLRKVRESLAEARTSYEELIKMCQERVGWLLESDEILSSTTVVLSR